MKGNKKEIKDTLIKETRDCKKNGFITSICTYFYAVFILVPSAFVFPVSSKMSFSSVQQPFLAQEQCVAGQ